MNYIKHLSGFFTLVRKDASLTASHISLYMALFQYWNISRFQNPFPIYRDNLMRQSKIGSKNTYHKCIRELHQAQYIYYHPSPSKFLPAKISVIRLDLPEIEITRYRQLDLFNEDAGPNIKTDSVPILGHIGINNETGAVPILGHFIKHKQIETESKQPPHKKSGENEKIKKQTGSPARVPKMVHSKFLPEIESPAPLFAEVEVFFSQNQYPVTEAKKFFNHYQAIGWKIKGITPITDWNAAAHKWMLNSEKYEPLKPHIPETPEHNDLQYLYECFLTGKRFFKYLQPEHFTMLRLQISDQTKHEAWAERIKQVSNTGKHSLNQVWDAYLHGKEDNVLLSKDRLNLIALAQKLEIEKHFQAQKQNGITTLNL